MKTYSLLSLYLGVFGVLKPPWDIFPKIYRKSARKWGVVATPEQVLKLQRNDEESVRGCPHAEGFGSPLWQGKKEVN
jgi:hypothetical protein